MTYEEILEKIKAFQVHGSKLGLERMENLLEFMEHPEKQLKVIHVAGTNGKGSVSRYISSVLLSEGYRVGGYYSPFLERFTESIEYNGCEISHDDLVQSAGKVLAAVEAMISRGYESPTEFELITVIALVFFAFKETDFVVLETGLGGTGDSTNVISSPLASVITSISLDHVNVLGHTVEEIAEAKAGIIKEGCAIVSMVENPAARQVIQNMAVKKQAPFIDGTPITAEIQRENLEGTSFSAEIMGTKYTNIEISMVGSHQIKNALCALTVIEYIRQYKNVKFTEKGIHLGMSLARHPGRFEIIRTSPAVVLDGAHNEAGVQALTQTVLHHFSGKRLLLCIGILQDKRVKEMVDLLSVLQADLVVTEPLNSRKLEAQKLKMVVEEQWRENQGKVLGGFPDPGEAFTFVESIKKNYDAVIYAGSLYLIGKIRSLYGA